MKSLEYPENENRAGRIRKASDFIPDVKIKPLFCIL
jgi:hypothetical protein